MLNPWSLKLYIGLYLLHIPDKPFTLEVTLLRCFCETAILLDRRHYMWSLGLEHGFTKDQAGIKIQHCPWTHRYDTRSDWS